MSVRYSSDWPTYTRKESPNRLHAVLSAGEAKRKADAVTPVRHQSSFEQAKAQPPALRPQSSYDKPDHYNDDRTWGEWAYEKYDSSKEALKGASRYAQDKYNDAASLYGARKVRRKIRALEEEMSKIELDSPEYRQKVAEIMALQDQLLVLEHGIAARFGLMSVDEEEAKA